ncbi:MAG: hypothetical protein V4719_31460, partial [Planctomycetota bacterium]
EKPHLQSGRVSKFEHPTPDAKHLAYRADVIRVNNWHLGAIITINFGPASGPQDRSDVDQAVPDAARGGLFFNVRFNICVRLKDERFSRYQHQCSRSSGTA